MVSVITKDSYNISVSSVRKNISSFFFNCVATFLNTWLQVQFSSKFRKKNIFYWRKEMRKPKIYISII